MHTMSFYWSPNIGDFFFKGLTVNGVGPFILLCTVLVLASVVYEAMKVHSAKVRARAARERLRASSCAPSETANLLAADRSGDDGDTVRCCSRRTFKMLAEAAVFLVHNTLGYALMLSVMVFNGYVFIAVVLGMGLGYFLFGHVSMRVNMENMQARTTKVICSPACADDQPSSSAGRSPIGDCADQLGAHASTSSPPSTAATVMQHKPQLHYHPHHSSPQHNNYQSTQHCSTMSTAVPDAAQRSSSSSPSLDDNSRSHIVDSCRL